jgi:hypothetical protein
VAAESMMFEGGQPCQQDAARFALVARQRERAAQHIAGR